VRVAGDRVAEAVDNDEPDLLLLYELSEYRDVLG
jgi:hypothetical protein